MANHLKWPEERIIRVIQEIVERYGKVIHTCLPVGLLSHFQWLVKNGKYLTVGEAIERITGVITQKRQVEKRKGRREVSFQPERRVSEGGVVVIYRNVPGRNGHYGNSAGNSALGQTSKVGVRSAAVRVPRVRFQCMRCGKIFPKIPNSSPGTCPKCKRETFYITVQ
ncbi:MAG: hypothetical protein ABIG08_02940 [bacterium]